MYLLSFLLSFIYFQSIYLVRGEETNYDISHVPTMKSHQKGLFPIPEATTVSSFKHTSPPTLKPHTPLLQKYSSSIDVRSRIKSPSFISLPNYCLGAQTAIAGSAFSSRLSLDSLSAHDGTELDVVDQDTNTENISVIGLEIERQGE